MRLVRVLALSIPLLCLSAAQASTFTPGEFATVTSIDWGYDYTSGSVYPPGGYGPELLVNNYDNVYAASSDLFIVGGGYTMTFTTGADVWAYVGSASGRSPGVLSVSLLDPTNVAGFFGATTVGLALDVDFSATGVLAHPDGVNFGDLIFTDLEDDSEINPSLAAAFDGKTVSEFLAYQESVLGGASTPYALGDIDYLSAETSNAFAGDNVSSFASDHLEMPASQGPPSPAPEPPTWMLLLAASAALPLLGRRSC